MADTSKMKTSKQRKIKKNEPPTEIQLRPSDIRYSQSSISNTMQDGTKIGQFLDDIYFGRCFASAVKMIRVASVENTWVTADNRRLWIFKQLEIAGRIDFVTAKIIKEVDHDKMTSENGGVSVAIRNGSPGGVLYATINDECEKTKKRRRKRKNMRYGKLNKGNKNGNSVERSTDVVRSTPREQYLYSEGKLPFASDLSDSEPVKINCKDFREPSVASFEDKTNLHSYLFSVDEVSWADLCYHDEDGDKEGMEEEEEYTSFCRVLHGEHKRWSEHWASDNAIGTSENVLATSEDIATGKRLLNASIRDVQSFDTNYGIDLPLNTNNDDVRVYGCEHIDERSPEEYSLYSSFSFEHSGVKNNTWDHSVAKPKPVVSFSKGPFKSSNDPTYLYFNMEACAQESDLNFKAQSSERSCSSDINRTGQGALCFDISNRAYRNHNTCCSSPDALETDKYSVCGSCSYRAADCKESSGGTSSSCGKEQDLIDLIKSKVCSVATFFKRLLS